MCSCGGAFWESEHRVPVEEFTHPGDPLKLDYGYRYNGTRGYLHAIALDRDVSQSKVLAYTAGIHPRAPTEFDFYGGDQRRAGFWKIPGTDLLSKRFKHRTFPFCRSGRSSNSRKNCVPGCNECTHAGRRQALSRREIFGFNRAGLEITSHSTGIL